MNDLFSKFDDDGTPHAIVGPRCERFQEFCDRFAGDRADPLKDIGDCGRYILELSIRDIPFTHLIARY